MDGGTGVYMQEVHVHAGTEEVLCPLDQDQWGLYLMGWNEFSRKSTLGHAGIYFVSINPIGEIKFSIGDGDEVRHNKISIIKLMR